MKSQMCPIKRKNLLEIIITYKLNDESEKTLIFCIETFESKERNFWAFKSLYIVTSKNNVRNTFVFKFIFKLKRQFITSLNYVYVIQKSN